MSTDYQEASIPEQRQWARPAAVAHGLDLAREFDDPGIPGSEIEQRPGLMALVAYCQAEFARGRSVRYIIAWTADRLSRASSIRTAAVLDDLMNAGVRYIVTHEEVIDLEDDSDVLLWNVKQDFSRAAYSKSISANVTRNAAGRAARGWHVAGRARYALRPVYVTTRSEKTGKERRTPTTLELGDPREVEAMRWAFRQYATTADSLGDLVTRLNDMGPGAAPPPRPNRRNGVVPPAAWRRDTLWRLLTDPVYAGDAVWGDHSQAKYYRFADGQVRKVEGGGKGRRYECVPEEDRVIVRDAHPALIDRETFEAVQRKLRASRWTRERHSGRRGEWVLSGRVYCGCCGGRMIGHTQRPRRKGKTYTYRRYVCRTTHVKGKGACRSCSAEQDLVVKEVARIIKSAFADPAALKALERELEELAKKSDREAARERKALQARLRELERTIPSAARNLLLVSDANRPDAESALLAMKGEREDIARRLQKVDAVAEAGEEYARTVKDALSELGRIEETIAGASPAKVRTLLSRWVERVTLHFEPPRRMRDGRSRNVLSHIDIDFTDEVAHLLPGAATRRC
jgi:DNA invertase Pin-like site-specific DNA recombinase